jgi:hypothetical protein
MSRADFLQAAGESFGDCICPPIPFEDASAHECCEVLTEALGDGFTPDRLAALTDTEMATLATRFGDYFESEPPSPAQIRQAVERTLRRWPVGSV